MLVLVPHAGFLSSEGRESGSSTETDAETFGFLADEVMNLQGHVK